MILEELMLDLMYRLPNNKRVRDLEITSDMVERRDLSMCLLEKRDNWILEVGAHLRQFAFFANWLRWDIYSYSSLFKCAFFRKCSCSQIAIFVSMAS